MSSILKALKKLEDDTSEQGGPDTSLPLSPDAKKVFRKGGRKNQGKLIWGAFGMTALLTLVWFVADRNPAATSPEQIYTQSESRTVTDSDSKSNAPASSKAVPEQKAEIPKTDITAPASAFGPEPPAPAETQKNMTEFRDMAAKQAKKAGENDPFRMPEALMESLSSAAEKSNDKAVSETPKPVPLLPEPKNPVKTGSLPLLPAPKNPVKPETAVPAPQTLPVSGVKKMQEAEALTVSGQPEPVKVPVPSEPVGKNAQTEPVKVPVPSEPVGKNAQTEPVKVVPSEPVKTSVPSAPVNEPVKESVPPEPLKKAVQTEPVKGALTPEQKDCASVSEKTAGETGLFIQALVWSEDPEGRMAVINGSIVREKGMVTDVSVIHIGSDCIVFQKGNTKWMQKFRLN
ncbi:MAG: hypothetical protein AB7S75_19910 [Desulfococcaceae bacterium]